MSKQHGRRSTYNTGCRCDPCKMAAAEAHQRYKARRPEWSAELAASREHGVAATYNRGCRCKRCASAKAKANAASLAKRVAANRDMPTDLRHGASAYKTWGCRCDICSAGIDQERRRTRERLSAGEVRHINGGWSPNCRCEQCRRKHGLDHKAKNDQSRQSARNAGKQWTSAELELISRRDLTAKELSTMLGRTLYSIRAQRHLLNKQDPKTVAHLGLPEDSTSH